MIDVARAHGITIVSISDHDNLAAFFEVKRYADSVDVTLIPGVELSCEYKGVDVHVLAYAFDPTDDAIDSRLRQFREGRATRGRRMVEKLTSLGYTIAPNRVDELAAGGSVGRPHVARALVERGYVKSVDEAFKTLLRPGMPGYVEKDRFAIAEAISLIRAAGGVTSIAHPTLYPNGDAIVPELLDAGIDGVEVMHPDVNEAARERFSNIARFRGKMLTGGSDDHGTVKKTETLGTIKVPDNLIGPILERL